MTDRPIIFSAPMVLALLAGTKTQTRRLAWRWAKARTDRHLSNDDADGTHQPSPWRKVQPGDRLWVREAWAPLGFRSGDGSEYLYRVDADEDGRVPYLVSGTPVGGGVGSARVDRWRSPIHMPRRASRLTLTVTDVRVQRLQEMTEADAQAEGIAQFENGRWHYEPNPEPAYARLTGPTARDAFHDLWHTIHGPGAWDANPEVVALTFTVAQRNIDA